MKQARAKSDRYAAMAEALRRVSPGDRGRMLVSASRAGAAALQEAFDLLEPRSKGPHRRSEAYQDLLRAAVELQEAQSLCEEDAAAAMLKKLRLRKDLGTVLVGEKWEEKETIRKRLIRDLRGARASARLADEERRRKAAAVEAEWNKGAAAARRVMARVAGRLEPPARRLPPIDSRFAADLCRVPAKSVTRDELEGFMDEFKRTTDGWRAPQDKKRGRGVA